MHGRFWFGVRNLQRVASTPRRERRRSRRAQVLYEFRDRSYAEDIDDFEDLYLHDSFFASLPHACEINALLGRTFADIEEEGRPEFVVYNVGVDADGLFIEYYSADLKGVPRAQKDRHWCHYEANKHWIEWVDDGLSERANVGSKKARAALPASLR